MEDEKLNLKLKTGIVEIRKIAMNALEKEHALKNILHSTVSPLSPVPSPWGFHSFTILIQKNRLLSYVVASCLILVLGGTGAVYASLDSLPGNILYPLKVNIIESVYSTFTFSLEGKAEYESGLATMRLIEAETLADRGELDAEKEKILTVLLESHTTALGKNLGKIQQKQPAEDKNRKEDDEKDRDRADKIINNFQSEMNTHAQLLDTIQARGKKDGKNEKTESSKSARESANKIKDSFKSKE